MMLLVGEYGSEAASPAPERPSSEGSRGLDRRIVGIILAVFFALAAAGGLAASPSTASCDHGQQAHTAAACSQRP
jgi:hypothetical protein